MSIFPCPTLKKNKKNKIKNKVNRYDNMTLSKYTVPNSTPKNDPTDNK